MGQTAVLPVEDTSAKELYLAGLESRVVGWQRTVRELAQRGDADGAGRALAEELREMGRGALGLDFDLLAEELAACRALVQGALVLGGFEGSTGADLTAALRRIGKYASEQRTRRAPVPQRNRGQGSFDIVFIGARRLMEGLMAEDWAVEDGSPTLRIERCDVPGLDDAMARRPPRVVVVDVDGEGAAEVAARLLDDEGPAVVAIGSFERPEDAAALVAQGVARTLPKPVTPGVLRRACFEASPPTERPFEPIHTTTVQKLSMRLASELQRGLGDAVDGRARVRDLDLDGGAEVLTVLWDAVARIRELVSARSNGAIRFAAAGPIEALPRASWLSTSRRKSPDRAPAQQGRRAAGAARLDGCRIVVAEDDLSVNWFIAGVLREAGADVVSVRDGQEALVEVLRRRPDVVLTDIVMPRLDGLSLCRALHADVLLRSVPVVMLSWKEDLLQRMRELGADAEGYLLKQADDATILQQVAEVIAPRGAIALRLREPGEVRGRLDSLTAIDLLQLVRQHRPDARITLRDASSCIELDVRAGLPVRITRTDEEGETTRGPDVMAGLLHLGAGRFGVEDLDAGEALTAELSGSLDEQLLEPIARVRAAQSLLSGSSLLAVAEIDLDLEACLVATPDPAASLLRRIANGASPRTLVVDGITTATLLEQVLADSARRGAVRAVLLEDGTDALGPAVEGQRALQAGEGSAELASATLGAAPAPELEGEHDSPSAAVIEEDEDSGPIERFIVDEPRERASNHTPVFAPAVVSARTGHTPMSSTVIADDAPALAALEPEPVAKKVAAEPAAPPPAEEPSAKESAEPAPKARISEGPRLPRLPGPSAWATRAPEPPAPKKSGYGLPVMFGVIGVSLALAARYYHESRPVAAPPPAAVTTASPPTPTGSAEAAPGEAAPTDTGAPPPAVDPSPQELPLTVEDAKRLEAGQGLLEVVAGKSHEVWIDGEKVGEGVVKVPLDAGDQPHEVRVKLDGEERVRYVKIIAKKRLRLRIAPPWQQ